MEIFISWSGQLSKEIGEIINNWIPAVLQNIKPYFTPDDVEKGTRWSSEIAKELQESQVGILVLTRENLLSPWIMFEAGALSKQMDKSRICPMLFGIENTDLTGPLVQFQATAFNKTDVSKLIKTINSACDEHKLEDSVLDDVFEMWWPKLETEINSKLRIRKERPDEILRSDRDLIEEILSLVRVSSSEIQIEPSVDYSPAALEDLFRFYTRLRNAINEQDTEMIKDASVAIGRPIDYLTRKLRYERAKQRSFRKKPRVTKEEAKEDSIDDEEEE